ncbi:hypothetical protein WJX81_007973 [Elliptochloris bilobata]|uniref:Cdc23 domain-containing protein n=1 Tax=Elliptochloris bilobata TaxID=381761 RepID=A0AAW1QXA4_9CHLO
MPAAQKAAELRQAVRDLRARGLYSSAQWAAQQLAGLPQAEVAPELQLRPEVLGAEEEDDAYLLAKSYFDMKEYRRAAHTLRGTAGAMALFLRGYSQYLAGERRREQERVEADGLLGKLDIANAEVEELDAELSAAVHTGHADAFVSYLHGLVLSDRGRRAEAREKLGLARQFPGSEWVAAAAAGAQYNLRNFDEAQELFEDLLERDPHRIEGMDTYSNILYVKEQFAALSHLAHRTAVADKYRPETCCIIGNYYSLKGQHEQAVLYFRRALRLNRNYLSAWTLMGHEYVEMKNPPAAVEAYRRAVDLNPRDYRAWYGLGQTYELLHMPFYALHYFRRATQLRPHDARMWCAMGQCYENEALGWDEAAVRCYRRAHLSGDREGIALHKLARIYERRGEAEEAARCYEENLARIDAERLAGSDTLDALLFLAAYKKDQGALEEAERHCLRLLDYGAPSKEKAKALLREIRALHRASASFDTPAPRGDPPSSPGSDIDISPDS